MHECNGKPRRQEALRVPATAQWVSTTTGRLTTCPYSWMQAVHWVGGSGLYTPSRIHGPKWGPTTVLVAQELSALTECRPGVNYLTRKLKLSRRTVQYHLDMLREAGLLVYRTKGTRITGSIRQASVYERVIPAEFDEALGIRTVQHDETAPAHTRVPVGIAEEGRKLIGRLAKKAARKVRRRRTRTPNWGRSRCTPMEGGTSTSSPTAISTSPSETKLASGSTSHPPQKKAGHRPQKLNKTGRRYQLGHELVTNVPWLQRASVPRISWIARHCADEGWTWREVQAAAEEHSPIDPADTRRPSGLLAHRIKGSHLLYADPNSRRLMVLEWQESRAQEHFRHAGYDQRAPHRVPASSRVREAQGAIRAALQAANAPRPTRSDEENEPMYAAGDLDLRALTPQEIGIHRAYATADPTYVRSLLHTMTDTAVRQLLTSNLVDQALAALRLTEMEPVLAF
ncbi:helix-turn-helix domain-containing protein [Streptomyces sp. NBC_00378]|uniref:helix-turn-helix domain-containing protein n=1 Tax=unclassified Streptomyces TaxID=2593676 RepID=UPI0022537EC9|nr:MULTISPECIES: helix-turn-helix domain-containing protein [unclassified Streptomyces]MCX5115170.1 helix-turn-helix domain-containing protein [Streptomyces sp. NBC_00378]